MEGGLIRRLGLRAAIPKSMAGTVGVAKVIRGRNPTLAQQLEETEGYKGDWLGLQTLDKAGKLTKLSYDGDHLRWSQSFWEEKILPLLGPEAGEETLVV